MRRNRLSTAFALASAMACWAVDAPSAAAQEVQLEQAQRHRFLRVEVAENGTLFVPDTEPVVDGLPAYGGEFITSGYLYPDGTLTCSVVDPETGALGCNGVNADGSPEFPDKVIGTWTCRGWHVGDGAFTESGAWVATSQIFSFTPEIAQEYGLRTITTDGFESPEPVQVRRAVTGGTGIFSGVSGEQLQTFLGWNPSVGVSLEVRFRLRWS
jgi:hypothetical protein